MAWTSPRTWVTGELVSASIMNTHIRDNFLATAPAVVTTAGDMVYASGANALSRLAAVAAGSILASNGVGAAPVWTTSPTINGNLTLTGQANPQIAINSTSGTSTTATLVLASRNAGGAAGNWGLIARSNLYIFIGNTGNEPTTAAGIYAYLSGGLFVGASPSDPGVGNIIAAGTMMVGNTTRNTSRIGLNRIEAWGSAYDSSGINVAWGTTTVDQGPNIGWLMNNLSGIPVRYAAISARIASSTASAETGYMAIYTIISGTEAERWRVSSGGHWLAGSDGAYDIGASGATRPRALYMIGNITMDGIAGLSRTVTLDRSNGTGLNGNGGTSIVIQAGGAKSGSLNASGGTLYLQGGIATGNNGSGVVILAQGGLGSGTSDGVNGTMASFDGGSHNIGLLGTGAYNGGVGIINLYDCTTTPTGNPTGGGYLYSQSGAGKWRGSSGTITTFGPAEPHCPTCGRDFVVEWNNPDTGHLAVCLWCLTEHNRKGVFIRC